MLNYLSGELYKLCRHKSLYFGVGLLLLLECAIFLPNFLAEEDIAFKQEFLLTFFDIALFVGVFVAPIFATLVFDEQSRNGTLKNEIVYGIPRSRIYFGKLIAGWVAGTTSAILVAAVYLLFALLLSTPFFDENTKPLLLGALFNFAGHWLTWLSVYSFTFFLLMLLKNTVTAVGIVYIVTVIGFPFSIAGISAEDLAPWLQTMLRSFYTAPLAYCVTGDLFLGVTIAGVEQSASVLAMPGGAMNTFLPYALGVCLLWTAGLSLLGLLIFSRREIK